MASLSLVLLRMTLLSLSLLPNLLHAHQQQGEGLPCVIPENNVLPTVKPFPVYTEEEAQKVTSPPPAAPVTGAAPTPPANLIPGEGEPPASHPEAAPQTPAPHLTAAPEQPTVTHPTASPPSHPVPAPATVAPPPPPTTASAPVTSPPAAPTSSLSHPPAAGGNNPGHPITAPSHYSPILTPEVPQLCQTPYISFQIEGGVQVLEDGKVAKAIVSLTKDAPTDIKAVVSLSTAVQGLHISPRTLSFNGHGHPTSYTVLIRSVTGSSSSAKGTKSGDLLDLGLQLDWACPTLPKCYQKVALKRKLRDIGRGCGWGDPHMKTLDGVSYDFHEAGYFRLFQSRNLAVQVYQEKCGNVRQPGAPACYQGAAVQFAGSVVRLMIQDKKIAIAKGTETAEHLSVEAITTPKADGYRIFVTADPGTYVDVNLGLWDTFNNYPYLNVALEVSPYFKDSSVSGLLGNWNDNPADDVKDAKQLAGLYAVPAKDNLFDCMVGGCAGLVKPLEEADKLDGGDYTAAVAFAAAHQGYTPISDSIIALKALIPSPASKKRTLRQEQTRGRKLIEEAEVTALCRQVVDEYSLCGKYIPDVDFYAQTVCAADALLLQDLSVVDNAKLAFLRDCRREIDARLGAKVEDSSVLAEVERDRAQLMLGTLSCPNNCSGRGSCVPSGCKCDSGFTGMGCTLAY